MFFKNLTQKQKSFVIILAGIFATVIILSIVTLINHAGKVATTVYFAPLPSSITANGVKIRNNKTVYLRPGEYDITVECDHFKSYSTTLTIDKQFHYIVGELEPSDEEGQSYLEKHTYEYQKAERYASLATNAEGERTKNKYPILKHLPINNSLYSISYSYDENKEPVITVKSDYEYIDVAVAKLKLLEGVDATEYKIVFTPKNPYMYPVENFSTDPVDFVKKSYKNKDKFYISETATYDNGNYAGMVLYRYDSYREMYYCSYRVILHKTEQGNWEFAANPQPFFTKDNASSVPIEIIKQVNELSYVN